MRLKKGTKVEVFTQEEVPSGSWRYAEIIDSNGGYYTVRYDGEGVVEERVAKKVIRPCPPLVDLLLEDWILGDVVEVFHNFSWKMATVLKVFSGGDRFLVRLLGSAIEFKSIMCNVRARLCWQDGEWIVIGKASSKCEDLRFRLPSSQTNNNLSQKMGTNVGRSIKGNDVSTRNIRRALESHVIPSKTLKRKPSYCHQDVEDYARRHQKIRVTEKHSSRHKFNLIQQSELPEKVDDVACSPEMLVEKCMHPSFVNKITGNSELTMERKKTDGVVGRSLSISLESVDNGSVSSSVGSCSVYGNYSHNLRNVFNASPYKDNNSESSDAESFCQLKTDQETPAKEELTEEVHRLELHAYRCIIVALHASGPLSWELELLLTNLRDSLHISSDEHLMEIRNLVPSSSCIPSC